MPDLGERGDIGVWLSKNYICEKSVKGERKMEQNKMKWRLKSRFFIRVFFEPFVMTMYIAAWYNLYTLCRYGISVKRVLFLSACFIAMVGYFAWWISLYKDYKKNSPVRFYRKASYAGNSFLLTDGEGKEFRVLCRDIKCAQVKKNAVYFFLDGCRYVQLNVDICEKPEDNQEEAQAEKENFILMCLRLNSTIFTKKFDLMFLICFLMIAATVAGTVGIYRCAQPNGGKLSWYLEELQNERSVKLSQKHKNVYDTGMEGVLADIREKVDLPEKLCMATVFNLNFLADGTIDTLDTMLYGFDENGYFVRSYVIAYDRRQSGKINISIKELSEGIYDADKDFGVLVDAINAINLEEAVSGWNEEIYGISYYGVLEWKLWDGGLLCINQAGEAWEPYGGDNTITGYSVSVFCPENQGIVPWWYLYQADAQAIPNRSVR